MAGLAPRLAGPGGGRCPATGACPRRPTGGSRSDGSPARRARGNGAPERAGEPAPTPGRRTRHAHGRGHPRPPERRLGRPPRHRLREMRARGEHGARRGPGVALPPPPPPPRGRATTTEGAEPTTKGRETGGRREHAQSGPEGSERPRRQPRPAGTGREAPAGTASGGKGAQPIRRGAGARDETNEPEKGNERRAQIRRAARRPRASGTTIRRSANKSTPRPSFVPPFPYSTIPFTMGPLVCDCPLPAAIPTGAADSHAITDQPIVNGLSRHNGSNKSTPHVL